MKILEEYSDFHKKVENTPIHLTHFSRSLNRSLHAAIGMTGEASEILDLFKKTLYGKQQPLTREKLLAELGDLYWYFHLMMDANGLTLNEVLSFNIAKLSKRYEEKL
jgi:phosphoribosyl-ATP pyrophosphohydrolase